VKTKHLISYFLSNKKHTKFREDRDRRKDRDKTQYTLIKQTTHAYGENDLDSPPVYRHHLSYDDCLEDEVIITAVLCCVAHDNCTQWYAHIRE